MPSPADTAKEVGMKKLKSAISSKVMDETIASDGVNALMGKGLTQTAANSTFKKAFGYATLFIEFVDAYSKAVAAAELDEVRKTIEVCPHIGQCENNGHAMRMADYTTATVWQYKNFWYFHPQWNYDVQSSRQIYRTTPDGRWRIEHAGDCRIVTEDCWGCLGARIQRLSR